MNRHLFAFISILGLFFCCSPAKQLNKTIPLKNIPADMTGNFQDDYGIRYTISDTAWIQHSKIKYHLLRYDSAGQFFIARNAMTNPTEPGLYTRIDVMRFSNMEPWRWGFCLTTYNAATVEEAVSRQVADRANPRKGCGGYPFSRMKRD